MIEQQEIRQLTKLIEKRGKLRAQLASLDKVVNAAEKAMLERLHAKEPVEFGRMTLAVFMKRVFISPFKTICLERMTEEELQARVDEIGYTVREQLLVSERFDTVQKRKVG